MVYNPFINPAVNLQRPDKSAQFSPWYQMQFNQGAFQPYYNPFQGAFGPDQSLPVIEPPQEASPAPAPEQPKSLVVQAERGEGTDPEEFRRIALQRLSRTPPKNITGNLVPQDYGLPGAIGKGLSAIGAWSIERQNDAVANKHGQSYNWGGHRFTLHEGFIPGTTVVTGVLPQGVTLQDAIEATGYVNPNEKSASQILKDTLGLGGDDGPSFTDNRSIIDRVKESVMSDAEIREQSRRQDPRQEHQYSGGGGPDYGSGATRSESGRHGSGTGGQARSGEAVSRDHDWSAAKDGGLIAMNVGGYAMNPLVHYRQVGGDLPPGPELIDGVPAEEALAAQAPVPAGPPPGMAPPMGPQQPPQPPMPVEPPRKTFAEKVMEAHKLIKGGQTSVPTEMPMMPQPPMMDGQGDGPVMVHPEAGSLSPQMVGPDMGPDTVDAELEEGSFVMNPEGSEMFAEDLQMMVHGGEMHG